MTMSNPTQELHKYSKTYDSLGNMSGSSYGLVNQQKNETYTHDKVDRLTGVVSDITGNTSQNDYNLANHLTKFEGKNVTVDKIGSPQTVGTQELTYDSLGNRTSITDTTNPTTNKTYEWSVDNLLNEVSTHTSEASYEYDASGLVTKRTEGASTDNFLWDTTPENALLLSDGDYEYVYGANRVPLAQIDLTDSSIEYLHADINGSVIAVTTDNGYLGGVTNYGAYGKRQGSAISRFGFAGEWADPTTSYTYLRARWYDPSTGSFLSKDPLYEITQEAYGYANGNPLTNIDPSGLLASDLNAWERFWASDHLSFMDSDGFQNVSDGVSGFGDEVTFGGTNAVREAMGTNKVVNKCSTSYKVGGYTGVAGSFATPAGVAKQGGTTILKSFSNTGKGLWDKITPNKYPTIEYSRTKFPFIAENIYQAQKAGAPKVLTKISGKQANQNRKDSLRGIPSSPKGMSRDEYPFASSKEGGKGARVMDVPISEQSSQGGTMRAFYNKNNIKDGDKFRVRVTK